MLNIRTEGRRRIRISVFLIVKIVRKGIPFAVYFFYRKERKGHAKVAKWDIVIASREVGGA